ncbi:class I tRNA ligase family protein [Bacteriovorax sp. PP10]|uniref:Class I tRNA ligase family protein n=1 Tax=Bacteriovorax antarcticus TaxID=3088717 RepID=A0ABU5VX30_9BACT|nr:class I tRNA ligase family protein [Bacteriovorax sp. PP10]MEA9357606.1 class I tRNA ligase family protein [Bacteriovorax sp. PP10]
MNKPQYTPPTDVKSILQLVKRPKTAVVTGGMPYANGPLHLGHLAGAMVPPDIMARYMRMLIGKQNVLFVSGNDDHGSTSEVAAIKAGMPVREFIDQIHDKQVQTTTRYGISYDIFSGTSQPDCYPVHKETSQDFMIKLWQNKMLEKKTTKQWFDPKIQRFLQDRNVTGKCPNPNCTNEMAYSDECEVCGTQYDPSQLINPKSSLSDATPELRDTNHLWLDMWKVSDQLTEWIKSKQNKWRKGVFNEVYETVQPAFQFDNTNEPAFKEMRATLPKHKSRYAPGKKVVVQFENLADYQTGKSAMEEKGITCEPLDGWAHRSITRDVTWGIPVPAEIDPDMSGKTLYVWPDSLIAPISFTKVALAKQGRDPKEWERFWKDPEARIFQFLGQDNVYFYVLMQGAMWIGVNDNYTMTDVYSVFHLMVNGEKMSKSRGNFYSGDQLTEEMGYDPDQVRYFLSTLSLAEKQSNFDFDTFNERNKFLAGPLNAAMEKPIAAVHSKFGGVVPDGKILEKAEKETMKIVQMYVKNMEKADHITLLGQIENYARLINSMFVQYKPHDDRHDETERKDALFTCFYILKNLMIMLHPFVPATMEKVRLSLNLPEDVFSIDELGKPIPAGHAIGQKQQYFAAVEGSSEE